jgi:hypothetical protein
LVERRGEHKTKLKTKILYPSSTKVVTVNPSENVISGHTLTAFFLRGDDEEKIKNIIS